MNILSISGGGVRGLIPLYTLRKIEQKYNKPIAHIFDYYAGSSIGTVIISSLLITDDGINPKHTCSELYGMIEDLCKKIFSSTFMYRVTSIWGFRASKYPTDQLEKLLHEFFGDRKMKDLLKPVCFPSFDGIGQKPIYFTREEHGDLYLRDVLRATTAAPSYFDPKEMLIDGNKLMFKEIDLHAHKHLLYDSGIVVNNPALVAELHATKNMDIIDKTKIYELCLGTGTSVTPQPSNNGLWGWAFSIIGYLFSGFNQNEMYMLYLALKKENVEYVDVKIDNKYDVLDDASDDCIKYYTQQITDWMNNNETKFFEFMDRIIDNLKNHIQ